MNRDNFCNKLKLARAQANITQQAAAKNLKIPISSISAIESGQRKIDALELYSLAKLYSKDVEWFFEQPNQEQTKKTHPQNTKLTEAIILIENSPKEIQNSLANAIIAFFR